MSLHFYGEIRNIQYKAFLTEDLPEYSINEFNINETETFGKNNFQRRGNSFLKMGITQKNAQLSLWKNLQYFEFTVAFNCYSRS